MSDWPSAVSDGLSLPCGVCGVNPPFDWRCDDKTWAAVIPKHFRRGVVCLPCFAMMADEAQVEIAAGIECVQFVGPGYTVVLRPDFIVRHSDGQLTPYASADQPHES